MQFVEIIVMILLVFEVNALIFVGGIHGVGKTSWCKKMSVHLGMLYFSASELIAKERTDILSRDKKVYQVEENQRLLTNAVRRLRSSQAFLLDGHFCLLNKRNEVEKVPYQTFVDLNPSGIVILRDDVHSIHERLYDRDTRHYDLSFLEKFQKEEIKYAQYISAKLQCPICIITPYDNFDFSSFVNKCYEEGVR